MPRKRKYSTRDSDLYENSMIMRERIVFVRERNELIRERFIPIRECHDYVRENCLCAREKMRLYERASYQYENAMIMRVEHQYIPSRSQVFIQQPQVNNSQLQLTPLFKLQMLLQKHRHSS